ncbi:MAG: mechanosensitive ion channel [Candidatus Korarchaeota archaeon]|nr:mechanosensitive ion channel [Candidatus Korarchaeota archaeon]NIU82400.1 mechanosensitive ion channel [Candidatus Thorarchaeota archaeon]NIW12873.1 mechanosensitive ion channel [Candidatus Thorarchaeota archaeon]NIW51067.1 mechanosensitive ion channel [Candidatus Korarchaeota archaeon]
MVNLSNFLDNLVRILTERIIDVTLAVLVIGIGFSIYKLLTHEVQIFASRRGVRRHVAFTLQRIIGWIIGIILLIALFGVFGITVGTFGGVLTAVIGTIIGFAAINTLGNAIAGLIVMTSKPFTLGDRIYFNDQYADVIDIGIIYTKMYTLDNVLISVPNQQLLTSEIENFGKRKLVRRQCRITAGFEYEYRTVKNFLLEALEGVKHVLDTPEPTVRITNFQEFAVEYTLFYYIKEVKVLRQIESTVFERVLAMAKKYDIDLSTPRLLRSV